MDPNDQNTPDEEAKDYDYVEDMVSQQDDDSPYKDDSSPLVDNDDCDEDPSNNTDR